MLGKLGPDKKLERAIKVLVDDVLQQESANAQFMGKLTRYMDATDLELFNLDLVSRLRYDVSEARYEEVALAHQRTFEWLFHPECEKATMSANFPKWLESDQERLFWVTGKPGSGKSTLMKFIWRHDSFEKSVNKWAGEEKLYLASFFFWSSGASIQMSQEGLLRKLLHDILRQRPDLAAVAFPHRLESHILFGPANIEAQAWKWNELVRAFKILLGRLTQTSKILLMIDGLDEFAGEPGNIVAFVKSSLIPRVKVCISSRSWIVFEDAFRNQPTLQLEHLTHEDIRLYVEQSLLDNPGYCTLQALDPQYAQQLIANVTTKAAGVFLWVYLVVQSLLEGLTEGERLSDLQVRLDSLPEDLALLFLKILQNLSPRHFQRALNLFKLMHASIFPATLLLLSFADEDDINYVFSLEVAPLSQEHVRLRCELMRRRLKACCKGLLEASPPSEILPGPAGDAKINYLHRTFRDFLEHEDTWTKLEDPGEELFDANLHLAISYLAMLKTSPANDSEQKSMWHNVSYCLEHLSQIQDSGSQLYIQLLEELDRTAQQTTARDDLDDRGQAKPHWITTRMAFQADFDADFRHLAVQCQLLPYIEHIIATRGKDPAQKDLASMLWFATNRIRVMPDAYDRPTVPHKPYNLQLIELLLESGADANEKILGKTIWHSVVGNADFHDIELVKLFLKYGADSEEIMLHRYIKSLRMRGDLEAAADLQKAVKEMRRPKVTRLRRWVSKRLS